MWRVYGIYDTATGALLYVGSTHLPLKVRMSGHLSSGLLSCDAEYKGVKSDTARARATAMMEARIGERALHVRTFEKFPLRCQALAIEHLVISIKRPLFNTALTKPNRQARKRIEIGWRQELRDRFAEVRATLISEGVYQYGTTLIAIDPWLAKSRKRLSLWWSGSGTFRRQDEKVVEHMERATRVLIDARKALTPAAA